MSSEITWSDWLDFSPEQVSKTPEVSGVFMMHAAMKILYIGGSSNIRESIHQMLNKECTCDAKRFKYASAENYVQVKDTLLKEYKEKHAGDAPRCM